MLTAQVAAGSLPRLDKRLPRKPMTVHPVETTGRFGGSLKRVLSDTSDINGTVATICRVGLVEFDLHYQPVPAVAEWWQLEGNGRSYTFQLREGLRWSDGTPLTVDDIAFYFEDVLDNPVLTPTPPDWWVVSGEPGTFKRLGQTRFRLDFVAPHALLPKHLAFHSITSELLLPKHYLADFHPRYSSEEQANARAKGAGLDTWDKYFTDRNNLWTNPDRPVAGAWKTEETADGANTHATLVRNPYYWKVDPDGRQLPYVDRISYEFVGEKTVPLQAANGQVDLQYRGVGFEDMTLLIKNADRHNFAVRRWVSETPWVGIYTNQSHPDPVMRELMQSIDFRAGLSLAINRDEMNQIFYTGLGITTHPGPIAEDTYHVDGYGRRFTAYDVDEADRRLDEAGLEARDGDGWRLRSDGRRLELEILAIFGGEQYERVIGYWKKVGVKASLKVVPEELWVERVTSGSVDLPGYTAAGFLWDINPAWYVPISEYTYWAPQYGRWYATGGAEGEEPPPPIRRLQQLYDELKISTDAASRTRLGREIIRAHDHNVWMIGTVGTPFRPTVVSNDLINVLDSAVASFRAADEEVTWFEQVAFRNPQDH